MNDLHGYFTTDHIPIYVKKHVKTSVIKKMQIKATMKYHLTFSKMAILKTDNLQCWQEYRFMRIPLCSWWN